MIYSEKQNQKQKQILFQFADNKFHRILIALERLELHLEFKRGNTLKEQISLAQTAINTSRDIHDDTQIIPDEESYYSELCAQLTAFAVDTAKFQQDDYKEYHNSTMKFFLNDILEWYGGRDSQIPYNDVESVIIPLILLLNHQCDNSNIKEAFEKYVKPVKSIHEYTEEEQREGVMNGFINYIKSLEQVKEASQSITFEDENFSFTKHKRGEALDGYKRIFYALIELFKHKNDTIPAKVFINTVKQYCPEIAEQCPYISEEAVDQFTKEIPKCCENENIIISYTGEVLSIEEVKTDMFKIKIKDNVGAMKSFTISIETKEIENKSTKEILNLSIEESTVTELDNETSLSQSPTESSATTNAESTEVNIQLDDATQLDENSNNIEDEKKPEENLNSPDEINDDSTSGTSDKKKFFNRLFSKKD